MAKSGNKQTLDWHRNCLKNSTAHFESQKKRLALLEADIARTVQDNTTRAEQIAEAEKQGLTSFDAGLFNKKRPKAK